MLRLRKIIGLCAFFIATAQNYHHYYDIRKFNLGFAMGVNISEVRFQRLYYQGNKPLIAVYTKKIPGINLGMVTNTKLNKRFDLRFIPTVSLQQRNFKFRLIDSTFTRKLEAAYLDLPVGIRFNSDVWANFGAYLYSGFKFSINLMSDKRVRSDPTLIRIDRTDFAWEIAFGLRIYRDKVKLSPEIKYAIGLKNIYIPELEERPKPEYAITTQALMINLYFE